MSLLVIYKILGLLVNTFATDDKYTLLNSDNLMRQIQMLITKKETNFLNCFSVLLKSRSSFEDFGKKDDPQSLYISEVTGCQRWAQINVSKVLSHKTVQQVTW